jgi:hypothetical protein
VSASWSEGEDRNRREGAERPAAIELVELTRGRRTKATRAACVAAKVGMVHLARGCRVEEGE